MNKNTSLKELQVAAHKNAVEKGFWDEVPNIDRMVALIHGEVSEMHEEYRKGKAPTEIYYREDGKPEGIPSELADIVIRCVDLAEGYGIDLEKIVLEKMEFNSKRPYKHGKKF